MVVDFWHKNLHYKLYKQCGTLVDKTIFYRGFGRGAIVGTSYNRKRATKTTWAGILKVKRRRPPGQVFWRWSDVDHLGRYSEGEVT